MKTKTNEIELSFKLDKIDEIYDFFQMKTSEKYILKGAKVLDLVESPIKAQSITFDNGKSAFAMFEKKSIRLQDLQNQIDDKSIMVRKVLPIELKPLILGRLFLYALSNSIFSDFQFNNLTGKLYVFFSGKNLKYLKALSIDLTNFNESLKIEANATSFTRADAFKNKDDIKGYPRYYFSNNSTMKRVMDDEDSSLYVHKSFSNSKTRIPFISFSKKDIEKTKCFVLHKTIEEYNKRYDGLSSIMLKTFNIEKRLTSKKDKDFFDRTLDSLKDKTINFVNLDITPEDKTMFDILVQNLSSISNGFNVKISPNIEDKSLNVVFLHNEDYYLNNKFDDPYKSFKRNNVIQCVTAEDVGIDCTEIICKTILKELAIKNDIINKGKISLDDWASFNFTKKWVFGLLDNDVSYFLEINPDGTFKTIHPTGMFKTYKTDFYKNLDFILQSFKGKGKTLIADDKGNINVISCTGSFALPDEEVFLNPSRSIKNVENHMAGLSGINLYKIDDRIFYNVGTFDKGMPSSLPNASLFYECQVVKGDAIIESILESMSVLFVKWNNYTVYPYPVKYLREWIEIVRSKELG